MTTRKQPSSVRKGARSRPAKRGTAGRRIRESGSLTLPADCTVAQADTLKSALVRRLRQPRPVTIDVSALRRVDTAGLQLLAAFVRDRRVAGRALAWRGRAPALEAAAALLGLQGMLELPGEGEGAR